MRVTRLQLASVRCLERADLAPGEGLNLITGSNGAGKTSILEALHLLAYGRSFRGRVRDGLIRTGTEAVEVFAEWQEFGETRTHRVGLRHNGQKWEGRLDGQSVAQLGDLCAALAVVSFEPGSHSLVSGNGDPRRRFVDWGLFHVEQDFVPIWRRYARALKQRNALLKAGGDSRQLDTWDRELAEAGEPLTRRRQAYLARLQHHLSEMAASLVPELGTAEISFSPGWKRQEMSLADALLLARERDRAAGYTSAGPHRADWRIRYAHRPNDEDLSRGQAKLTALACLLAQAEDFLTQRGEWPIVILDDLASELDREHQRRVLERLLGNAAQVFVTGTELPPGVEMLAVAATRFHVEQGQVGLLPPA